MKLEKLKKAVGLKSDQRKDYVNLSLTWIIEWLFSHVLGLSKEQAEQAVVRNLKIPETIPISIQYILKDESILNVMESTFVIDSITSWKNACFIVRENDGEDVTCVDIDETIDANSKMVLGREDDANGIVEMSNGDENVLALTDTIWSSFNEFMVNRFKYHIMSMLNNDVKEVKVSLEFQPAEVIYVNPGENGENKVGEKYEI